LYLLKKTHFIFSFISLCLWASSQTAATKRYAQAQVLDSIEGVRIYNSIMKAVAAEYTDLPKDDPDIKGFNEEYHDNNNLKHISYYKQGQLVMYKNFFDDGKTEKSLFVNEPGVYCVEVYYDNGSLKHEMTFVNGTPKKLSEFYNNNLPKSEIEYDAEQKAVTHKRTWYSNGNFQSELILEDPKTKKYMEKLFYPNGQPKEEGELIYSSETKEYHKDGAWFAYDSNGKKKKAGKFSFKSASN
jgi:antitoxin component YwqK of YwqJK toxin-antitoxin module